jgi:hypothetical protein
MSLTDAIVKAGLRVGWDVYNVPFSPADLNIDASKFGSFSDHTDGTASSIYNRDNCLIVMSTNHKGRPETYVLKRTAV